MQVRRQDCRISSKPLVIFAPKYRFVQIREWSWGGRLPFPDLRAHDPLCACRRSLCFSVEVLLDVKFWQGRPQPLVDVATHGAEPDVRHVQDRVFHLAPHLLNRVEVGTAGRRATAGKDLRVFSRCVPHCRTRPALAVPCFSAASCPRRVCRDTPTICGLFQTRTAGHGRRRGARAPEPERPGSGNRVPKSRFLYENCYANSNLSEYYDPVRATARSHGSVSTSGITVFVYKITILANLYVPVS